MSDPRRRSSSLVGRRAELAALQDLVGVGSEPGGAVLLAGDAGVGKTRLLGELQEVAGAAGWRVLVGHCLDFGGDALPYLPFTEVFGRLAVESAELVDDLVAAAPALARLLPGRRLLTAGAGDRQGAAGRSDLFDAAAMAFERLDRTMRVLLVVEDVHWADSSTRDLLTFLMTREVRARSSIVASYRTDDLHRRHPLRAQAAQWSRLPGVTRLHLEPLPEPAVRDLVRLLEPTDLTAPDVDRIVARADGNPFFTEELVAAATHQAELPADFADLLLLNLDRLDDTARTVLRAISVAGRRAPHDLLAEVVGLAPAELDGALRAAVDHHLLVSDGGEGYAFRHALLAEAVYEDLLPGERVAWHHRYADVLRSGAVDGTAAELARHARAANDLATAVTASIQAGDEAMTVGGPAEATRHYESALELLAADRGAGRAGRPGVDVVDLVLRASESAAAAGHGQRAIALLRDQLAALPPTADPMSRVLLLIALATNALQDDGPVDALELTTEALHLPPAREPSPLRARVLAVHARANDSRGRDADAERWAGEAADLARTLHLPAVLADARTTLVRVTRQMAPEQAERSLRNSVAEARTAGDAGAELRGTHNLGSLLYGLRRLSESRAAFAQAAARAAELRRPWAPYGLEARVMAGIIDYERGAWDEAAARLDTRGEAPPPLAQALLTAAGLAVHAGRGDAGSADVLPALRPWWERDGMVAVLATAAAVDLSGDAGGLPAAVAAHDEAVASVGALWEDPDFEGRVRLSALLLAQLCAAATRSGSADRSALAASGGLLLAAARRAAAAVSAPGLETRAWAGRVEAEGLRLRWLTGDGHVDPARVGSDELVQAWVDSCAAFTASGHVYELARSRARLAAVLQAVGRPAEAVEPARLAREVARRLGARPLLAELRPLGGADPASPQAGEDHLTSREREVLALVAQGRSNREIAQVLYISPKTVSVHVSNVLAKLPAAGRTEAVAVARRRGLLAAGD